MIVLAGDLDRLPEQELVTRTGLLSIVNHVAVQLQVHLIARPRINTRIHMSLFVGGLKYLVLHAVFYLSHSTYWLN